MQRHDFIIGTLVRLGFRSSLKGFGQFCACVEHYADNRVATIESIYQTVADDFRCSRSAVEKNLRRLFLSSDAPKALGTLYGMKFTDTGNKEIVAAFCNFVELSRDCYEPDGKN